MNKRQLFRFFLMNQDPAAAGGGAPAVAPAPAPAAAATPAAAPAPAAATPAAAPAPAAAQTDPSPTNWLQSLPDADAKAYAESKGWKDPVDAVKAIRDMEGKYVVPENADAYQLPVPQGQDGAFAKEAAGWMHKAGIPVAQAQALAKEWNNAMAAQETARQAQVAQEMSALKTEWGTEFDTNVELGRRVMRNFGVAPEVIDRIAGQMGDATTLRVFQQIGKGLGEGTLGPGGSGGGSGSDPVDPEKARAARMFPSMQPKS
jgi:hypothetical protein